jgi:glutamyl-tRNA(Gln) amidotransferase subunit E
LTSKGEPLPTVKVGLEIHRQLDTKHKLFCSCPTDFAESESEPEDKFLRRLRPTQSELGQVDQAALFEFHRGRGIMYESDRQTSCLVEMDEEPPGKLNAEAVEICLTAALLVNAKPVDEIHVMRKVVIDGSNTTGFQRTSVVALGGTLRAAEKDVPIQQISLEEDAARKTGQSGNIVGFRIDRLGVPLIEVTTAPVINSPAEAEKVALAIGTTLRATRKVKRGLGSIRQDLNISIPNGALIEIKGVQELDLVGKAVELEVKRQQALIEIKDELARREVKPSSIERRYVDLSSVFTGTKARVLREAVARKGIVLGVRLPKFAGLLGKELVPGLRLGTELSNRASFWGGVGGIFHSDELPGYGITEQEVKRAREQIGLGSMDALVLVADEPLKAKEALDAVVDRALEALAGVPEETRMAMPDGSTRYMRPRPGAARMYPETDVPPTPVTEEYIARLKANLPETPELTVKRLEERFSINEKLAKQLLDSDYLKLFEQVAASSKVQASFIATTLSETCKSLERDGFTIHDIPDETVEAIFKLVDEGIMTKEAVAELLKWQSKNPRSDPKLGVNQLGLRMISERELEQIIDRHIEKNKKLVEERGSGAFSSLMGSVMSEVRGSIEPGLVAEKIKKKLTRPLNK